MTDEVHIPSGVWSFQLGFCSDDKSWYWRGWQDSEEEYSIATDDPSKLVHQILRDLELLIGFPGGGSSDLDFWRAVANEIPDLRSIPKDKRGGQRPRRAALRETQIE